MIWAVLQLALKLRLDLVFIIAVVGPAQYNLCWFEVMQYACTQLFGLCWQVFRLFVAAGAFVDCSLQSSKMLGWAADNSADVVVSHI